MHQIKLIINIHNHRCGFFTLTTAPKPKTATVELTSTLHVFHTAPNPVETPHPKRQTFSSGASWLIFAHEISAKTVYSLNFYYVYVQQPNQQIK